MATAKKKAKAAKPAASKSTRKDRSRTAAGTVVRASDEDEPKVPQPSKTHGYKKR